MSLPSIDADLLRWQSCVRSYITQQCEFKVCPPIRFEHVQLNIPGPYGPGVS